MPKNALASGLERLLAGRCPCSKQQKPWRGPDYAEPEHLAHFDAGLPA